MKKVRIACIVTICSVILVSYAIDIGTICDRTLRWSVGTIDEGFDISETEFIAVVNEAARLWEEASGRDLFTYDESARFTINLVYDNRQQESNRASETLEQLDVLKNQKTEAIEKYEMIQLYFNQTKEEYETLRNEYEQAVGEYNSAIAEANKKGSVSNEERERLEQERQALTVLRSALEEKQKDLNDIITELNQLASENNFIAEQYNRYADYFNSTFADRHFEQGEYSAEKIDVYQFRNVSDLTFVLTHELGHALSLDHVDNPDAIMHYVSVGRSDGQEVVLTSDDVTSLMNQCGVTEHIPWYRKIRLSSELQHILSYVAG